MFRMRKYEMLGFFIISLITIGLSLLLYLMPDNYIVDGIKPTSDSLWQIGKLMFFSILIYTIIEYYLFGKNFNNFLFAKSATLFLGPIIFIGLTYIIDLGFSLATPNSRILTYMIALVFGQYASYQILKDKIYFKLMNAYAVIGIILMIGIFIGFGRITNTFESPIFRSMDESNKYIRGF